MLNDWFRPLTTPMTWEQFRSLPRHAAYRYEYRNGQISISGNPHFCHCVRILEESPATCPPSHVLPLNSQMWHPLEDCFQDAFSSCAPFVHLDDEAQRAAAQSLLTRTREGADGVLHRLASQVSMDETGRVMGAILITLLPKGSLEDFTDALWQQSPPEDAEAIAWGQPHITWVFTRPEVAGQGRATQLLHAAEHVLVQCGYRELVSTFLQGDTRSMLWHWRRGFRLLPSLRARNLNASSRHPNA